MLCEKQRFRIERRDLLLILLGSGLTAFASKCIYDPNDLVIGGVSGLAILIRWLGETRFGIEIPLWVTTFVLNAPILLAAWRMRGFSFIYRVAFSTLVYTLWLAVIPRTVIVEGDMVLAAVFGALISGAGVGLVFRARSTTGGTETVAALLWPYFKHISVVRLLQILDGIIVGLGVFAFGISRTLYAVMAVYVASRVSDGILEGVKSARQAFVVTDRPKEAADGIMKRMERGVTGIRAMGMYSGKDRTMLYCVVNKKEIITLKEIVGQVDERAFLVVGDAREVLGEGFLGAEEW